MALFINTNVSSISAQRHLNKSASKLSTTFQRLSSGLRVNSAKDDAASLSISTAMTAQIRGLNQAARNANDVISLIQVADGALEETVNSLQRMRELAVQASNDTLTSSDRSDIQQEVDQLIAEINRISSDTEFNSQALLNGSFSGKTFQVGTFCNQTITLSVKNAAAGSIGVSGLTVTTGASATSAIGGIDDAINSVSDIRAKLGAVQNRFESVINSLATQSENLSAANSRMVDADITQETANLTKYAILQQAGTAILAQANQQPQLALQLLA